MPHLLQRVLFPLERDPDILPLYADPEVWTAVRGKPLRVSDDAHANDILGRDRFRVRTSRRVSFASYFNAFPAAYWQRWTVVGSVRLTVRTQGEGSIIVYRSNAQGVQQRVATNDLSGLTESVFDLPIRNFGDGGWYFHVADMATLPEHQGRGLGRLVLTDLLEQIAEVAPPDPYVTLMADAPGRRLYASMGFVETAPRSLGMVLVHDLRPG